MTIAEFTSKARKPFSEQMLFAHFPNCCSVSCSAVFENPAYNPNAVVVGKQKSTRTTTTALPQKVTDSHTFNSLSPDDQYVIIV